VASLVIKMRENRSKWLGHVLRTVKEMYVERKRGRGRPKKRWLDESDVKRASEFYDTRATDPK